MLWDIIRNFFVVHIFGGLCTDDYMVYEGFFGLESNGDEFTTGNLMINLGDYRFGIGDYLSSIATIICLVVIFLLCCAFIKKIYNMCAHIIG